MKFCMSAWYTILMDRVHYITEQVTLYYCRGYKILLYIRNNLLYRVQYITVQVRLNYYTGYTRLLYSIHYAPVQDILLRLLVSKSGAHALGMGTCTLHTITAHFTLHPASFICHTAL